LTVDLAMPPTTDLSEAEDSRLAGLAADVLERCRAGGATEAEVGLSIDTGLEVNVRMGEVETISHTRDRGLAITVYVGRRKGSASTADLAPSSIAATIGHALAIARHTGEDPAAGLADPARYPTEFPDLDLDHPWPITAEAAIDLALAAEAAGRSVDPRITNSDGAGVSTGRSVAVQANSAGFIGIERGTRHSLSCSLIAADDDGMQRDYWYSTTRAACDLEDPEFIGRRAAERALARLAARKLGTRECPVLFVPEAARSLVGHLVGAVSGGALYRKASFLVDHVGRTLFPTWFSIREEPLLRRGQGSSVFDADGVATRACDLVRDGVLVRYVLGTYSARKLGLESTGNGGGIHNLIVEPGARDFAGLLAEMGTGLVVTELMGQGVNLVTGDYSRGAAGFWVERGEIVFPVEEITIAGDLREVFARIGAVGNDVDRRSSILTGSILVERMMVAGA
jgi:PmbA protein